MAEGPPPAAAEAQGTPVQPSATPAEVAQPSATATWVLVTLAKPGKAPMGKAPPRLVEQMQARLTAALGRTSDDLLALPVQAGNAPPSSLPPMMKAPPPSLLALVPVKKAPPRPPPQVAKPWTMALLAKYPNGDAPRMKAPPTWWVEQAREALRRASDDTDTGPVWI